MMRVVATAAAGCSRVSAVGAALAVPLCYAPPLDSPFTAPKLALLVLCGGLGLGAEVLAIACAIPRPRWPRPLAIAVAALAATGLASAAAAWWRGPPGAPHALAELGRLAAVVGVTLAAAATAADERGRRNLLDAVHAAAGVVALVGLAQHLGLLPFALPVISVPGSTFGNRNMAGEAMAMAIPFGLAAISAGGRGRGTSAALVCFLALEIVYLAVTRTRGAWLGGLLGTAVFVVLRRPALPRGRRQVVAAVLAVALAGAVAAAALVPGRWTPRDALDGKRYASGARLVLDAVDPASPVVRTRLGLWRRTLAIYRGHPFTGVGLGNFPVSFPHHAEPRATADGVMSPHHVPRRAHNDILERLAETGPAGLAALLGLYAAAGLAALRRVRWRASAPDGDPAPIAATAGAAGSLAALLGCGLFGFPLAMPATALLFALALGMLAGIAVDTGAGAGAGVGEETGAGARAGGGRWTGTGRSIAGLLAAAAIMAGAATVALELLRASYWSARAMSALRAGDATRMMDAWARARRAAEIARVAPDTGGRYFVALRAAQTALRLGRNTEAAEAAAYALGLEPDSPQAWAALGAARLRTGDARGAAAAAERALTFLEDYPEARATLTEARGAGAAIPARSNAGVEPRGGR
jgi:O-antigen ligase